MTALAGGENFYVICRVVRRRAHRIAVRRPHSDLPDANSTRSVTGRRRFLNAHHRSLRNGALTVRDFERSLARNHQRRSCLGVGRTSRHIVYARDSPPYAGADPVPARIRRLVFEDSLCHVVLPAAYAALAVSAYATQSHAYEALFGVAAAASLLLFCGIHNAWDSVTYHLLNRKSEQSEPENTGRDETTGANASDRR